MSASDTKDSGVQWIGRVPAHWGVAKVCQIARLESGHTPSRQHPEYWIPEQCTIPWFSLADVWQLRDGTKFYLGDTAEKISPLGVANSAARLLPAGTVVLSRTASVGFSGIMPHPMATTQDFADWVCGSRLVPEYLLHCFRAMSDELRRFTMGSTHQTIYMPDLRRLTIPLPPITEQRLMVAFLSTKLSAVDALIAKKERLVELLQEKRQALITEAVTRGLDPSAPTKDSGVAWLGRIPAHWKLVKLSYVAAVCNGTTPNRERTVYWHQGTIPWLSSGKVNDYVVTAADEFITEKAFKENSMRVVPRGAVLIGMIGQGKTRGMSAYLSIDACINQNVAAIVPGRWLDGRFLHQLLTHAYEPIRENGRGGQQDALNCEILGSLRLPLPPVKEQQVIAAHLDHRIDLIIQTIKRLQHQVSCLREYRQALITEAVTGRIPLAEMAAARAQEGV